MPVQLFFNLSVFIRTVKRTQETDTTPQTTTPTNTTHHDDQGHTMQTSIPLHQNIVRIELKIEFGVSRILANK